MIKEQIYEAWAPADAIWSTWAKPVLFSYVDRVAVSAEEAQAPLAEIGWARDVDGATAIILDLPGSAAVDVSVALALLGYRPVPLYNAIPDPRARRDNILLGQSDLAIVPVSEILLGLARTAPKLMEIPLPPQAPPAFLLDANRRGAKCYLSPGRFDNRSISLPTDFPSASFLLSRGIRKAVIVQSDTLTVQPDLAHTLRRWQQDGIQILAKSLNEINAPLPVTINKPSHFRLFFYNVLATMGLKRSPFGGFGGYLPEPSSGNTG